MPPTAPMRLMMSFAFAKANKDVTITFVNLNGEKIDECTFNVNNNLHKCNDFKQSKGNFVGYGSCTWCIGESCGTPDDILNLQNKYKKNSFHHSIV